MPRMTLIPLSLVAISLVTTNGFIPVPNTFSRMVSRSLLRGSYENIPPPSSPDKFTVGPSMSSKLIYLVDDEEVLLSAISQYLEKAYPNYVIKKFTDANEPLKAMTEAVDSGTVSSKNSVIPDLIISDIRMPTLDGLTFLSLIRQHYSPLLSTLPMILLTAKGMTSDRIEGYKTGADAYLPKPFDPEELVAIIDSLLAKREASGEFMDSRLSDAINAPGLSTSRGDGSSGNLNKLSDLSTLSANIDVAEIKRDLESIKEMLGGNININTPQQKAARQKQISITPKEVS